MRSRRGFAVFWTRTGVRWCSEEITRSAIRCSVPCGPVIPSWPFSIWMRTAICMTYSRAIGSPTHVRLPGSWRKVWPTAWCRWGCAPSTGTSVIKPSRFGVEMIEMKDWNGGQMLEFEQPVYLSFDLDVIEPGLAPGVSHREPGGLTIRQAIDIIHSLRGALVGADFVEFNPVADSDRSHRVCQREAGEGAGGPHARGEDMNSLRYPSQPVAVLLLLFRFAPGAAQRPSLDYDKLQAETARAALRVSADQYQQSAWQRAGDRALAQAGTGARGNRRPDPGHGRARSGARELLCPSQGTRVREGDRTGAPHGRRPGHSRVVVGGSVRWTGQRRIYLGPRRAGHEGARHHPADDPHRYQAGGYPR